MDITLRNVRLSFPKLHKPGDKFGKFGANFIIEDQETLNLVAETIDKVAKEKWNDKAEKIMEKINMDGKNALFDGNTKLDKDGNVFEGYENAYVVSASNDVKPIIVDENDETLEAMTGKPYAGCYVNARVNVWAQDNKWGRRMNVKVKGVRFVADGTPFSGDVPADTKDF